MRPEINITTFILLSLINLFKTEFCGSYLPYNVTDCTRLSTISGYCCYYSVPDSEMANMCKSISIADYPNTQGYTVIGTNNFTINCGNTYTSNTATKCGNTTSTPKLATHCNIYSSTTDSCCYYNYAQEQGCYWLGAKYEGSVPYGNFILECGGNNIIINFSLYLLIFIMIYI